MSPSLKLPSSSGGQHDPAKEDRPDLTTMPPVIGMSAVGVGQIRKPSWGVSLPTQYSLIGVLLIAPAVLIFALVIAYPLGEAIYLSFFSIYTPTLQGEWVGLANYRAMLSTREFWAALGTNIVWTIGTLVLQVVIGVAIALLLNLNFYFRSLARSLILFPYFVSTVVAVLVWRWMFNDTYGILNRALVVSGLSDMPLDWLGAMPNAMISIILVGAWKYFPFVVIAVLARLQTIPEELYEAARIDGANVWSRFWDVTLPQLREVLIVIVLLRTIWDFKEFDLIYLLTGGGPIVATQTLPLLVYKQAFGMNAMGMASTYAIGIMVVLVTFMVLYLQRTRRGSELQ
jgi:multiple sugar transport system permease protein